MQLLHLSDRSFQLRSKSFSRSSIRMASEEDDLLLGAEAKSMIHQNFEDDSTSGINMSINRLSMTGKAGMSATDNAAEDVNLNLEKQVKLQAGLPHQESQNSEYSVPINSLDQILDERKGDPEMILHSLGFSGSYSDVNCRIPDRFLLTPSKAYGISVEKFLDGNPKLREFLEGKNAIQNPFEMMMTSAEVPSEKRRRTRTGSSSFFQTALAVTMVSRFKKLTEKGSWASLIRRGVPVAEVVMQETPRGCMYWSILPNDNRSYLERIGYYDEVWSSVSVACDPTEDSKLTPFSTAERRTASAEGASPKLLCIAYDLVSKQLHRGQEAGESSAGTKDNLTFSWAKPSGSSSSAQETEEIPESTVDVPAGGREPQFHPQINAKNIPSRFLANSSVLVPNHLTSFSESKLDLDLQQSMSDDSITMFHVGTETRCSTESRNELPTTESLYKVHDINIIRNLSSCSLETADCIDDDNRIISCREASAVSVTMDSKVSGSSELSQILTDSVNHERCLTPSRCTTFEGNGIFQGEKFIDSHDTLSTVLLVCGGDGEPADVVPVSDGVELSSSAVIRSSAVAASNDSLNCRSTARKERFCLRDFRDFSIDVPEAPTCSSNDLKMTSIIRGQSRLKDDLIPQLSLQSDSSGFVEGDQLDVSLLSINDATAQCNRLLNRERCRLKDSSCSQCSTFSVCESPDFTNSNCTQRPFSDGSDDCFHSFSEPSYKVPHCTACTQINSLDDCSCLPHRCFSDHNISQHADTCHGFQQNLLNNGASSKVERKTATDLLDNRCVSINDRSCISGDSVLSGDNASKRYRTEVTILVNKSPIEVQKHLETSQSSTCDLQKLHEDVNALDRRKDRNHNSVDVRLYQSSPGKYCFQSKSSMASLYRHHTESVRPGHSSRVRYHSNPVSFQPDQQSYSVRDWNQTRSLRDSFDLQESCNLSGRPQSSPSGHDDSGNASVICKRYEECFLDVSEHQMLQDQLKNSGFVNPQSLPSFTQPHKWPPESISSTQKWKQCVRDELKLMDFVVRKYKLENKLLHRRMCKVIDSSGCNTYPGVLLRDERDDLDMLEILHTEIMEELDKMEELLMQRLKRFLSSHAYEDGEHRPLSDMTSQSILHSMNQLLHEQDYQSNIVNSINFSGPSDQLSNCPLVSSPLISPPLVSSPPPLLLHSVPIVSLQQLSQCLSSVEMLLSEIQRKTDVIENSTPVQQPVQKFLDQNKELKRRKSYRRFLPACLKPQWPKKQPVFKQMSLPNTKHEDH